VQTWTLGCALHFLTQAQMTTLAQFNTISLSHISSLDLRPGTLASIPTDSRRTQTQSNLFLFLSACLPTLRITRSP
jgi:hypothetical protein